MNKNAGWEIRDYSESPNILEPLGLICDNGYFEDEECKIKMYYVRSIYSYSDTKNGLLLTQKQFDYLLKTKPIIKSKRHFEMWLEKFKRKEKLEKINHYVR